MNENMNQTSNKLFDLWSESYNTMLNGMLWGTQRMLELNKAVVGQLEVSQIEGRKYVEDLNAKTREGLQVVQEMWQDSLKTYNTNVSSWRNATESSVMDLNRKVEQMQQRFEVSAN